MHDYESAAWADHHRQLSHAVHKLVRRTVAAFDRLQRLRFDAPWSAPALRRPVHR